MVHRALNFSRSGLVGPALVSLGMGATAGLVALGIPDDELIRASHGVGLVFGAEVVRWALWLCGACAVATGLAMLRRLAGDRVAAAIRHDGIELRGVFLSRRIPWRSIDRIYLRAFKVNSKIRYFIRVESRCPRDASPIHHFLASRSYGVAVDLVDATEAQAATWVVEAGAAWQAICGRQPRTKSARIGFGGRPA